MDNPKVICISENSPEDGDSNTWYTASTDQRSWNFQPGGIGGKKKIAEVTQKELDEATVGAGNLTVPGGDTYIIKLDKRPDGDGSGNNIKYRTKDKDIEVEKTEHNPSETNNKVPDGYVRYSHAATINGNIIYKHNGVDLRGLPRNVNIQNNPLWIYYKEVNSQPIIDRPLLIYVKVSTNDTWYRRGSKWELTTEVSGDPNENTSGISGQSENLFTGKLVRQGKFLELVCPDDMYLNSNYWNLYFIIQPYVDDVSPQLH